MRKARIRPAGAKSGIAGLSVRESRSSSQGNADTVRPHAGLAFHHRSGMMLRIQAREARGERF